MLIELPDGVSAVEATPDNLPDHVDQAPDSCGCPVILTYPDGMTVTCDVPVGWVLTEVEDTYCSGYERMTLADCWVAGDFWVICSECAEELNGPSGDEVPRALPSVPTDA